MGDLEDVDLDDLHAAMGAVGADKATLRVAVGVAYVNGVGPTELAEWYGVSRSTVYDWLDRLERLAEKPPEEALVDADRPGRPPKLSGTDRERLAAVLREPPEAAGYDAAGWTPDVVAEHVQTAYGTAYSRRHVRALLHDLGFAPGPDGFWRPKD